MATVDEAFDASFNAGKNSVQASAAVPISQFQPQATIAQATKINSFNALEAAITNNTQVQKQRADNADTISLAAAEASNKTALEVAEIAKQGIQAVEVGRQGLVQESLSAINAQKELSAIQANKPNAILHPIRWVADTLQSNKLEDAIQTHSKAVQVYNRNINNVVQNTTVQVEEMLSIQNLVNSNGLRLQAAELNKGLDAQQAGALGQKEKAVALDAVGGDIFAIAQANANWAQADFRNQLAAEQNRIAGRANDLAADDLQMKRDEAKHREGAIKQAAQFYLTQQNDGKGLPPTVANMNMAIERMSSLQKVGSPEFALWSKGGAFAINSTDPKAARQAAVQGMTVGEIVHLGNITKNSELAAIGGNQVNRLTQENEAALRKSSYMATLPAGKEFTQAGFDLWAGSLKAPQNAAFNARARAMAENVVYNQSPRSYMNGKAAGKDIGQAAINLAAFKSPLTLVNTYGISKQAATVLADPKVQMFLAHAGAGSTQDKKTAQFVAMFEVLEKNKVANPAGVVALIGKKTGEAALDADLEAKTLGQYGIVSDGSGVVTYKDKQYRLSNPVDMEKMRIAATKKEDSFFDTASNFLSDVAEGSGFNNFLADKAQKQEALKKSQAAKATVEQAAMTASKYTPAGFAPPVAGGVPATAQTEAEKAYAQVAAQVEQKETRAYTNQILSDAQAEVAYEQSAQQIEAKKVRAGTKKLADETAADAAYSIVSGQIDAKNARANSKQLASEVEADAAYAIAERQIKQGYEKGNVAGITQKLPLEVVRLLEASSPELSSAVATPVHELKATTQAVKEVEAAIKDGSLPKKQAVPIIKAKVQEAKKADEPKAAGKWDSLLDLVTGAAKAGNRFVAGAGWSSNPRDQAQYQNGLSASEATQQPSARHVASVFGMLSTDDEVIDTRFSADKKLKGYVVEVKVKGGASYIIPVTYDEIVKHTGANKADIRSSLTSDLRANAEVNRRVYRTAVDKLQVQLNSK